MAIHTNYEDNLYQLAAMLKYLQNIIYLDLDPNLFDDKIAADITFHDQMLHELGQRLIMSPQLLQRNELLRLLIIAHRNFNRFLEAVSDPAIKPGHVGIKLYQQCQDLIQQQQATIDQLSSVLYEALAEKTDDSDVISQDEYHCLFQSDSE
jgi:hypothetical protein